jgi:esterase/lipase superfamily enzyme
MNQVILAAPDVNKKDFEARVARILERSPTRITMYASDVDKALSVAARLVWENDRVGLVGPDGITVVDGVDSIDTSKVDAGWMGFLDLNHSSYADEMIGDVFQLIRHNHSPDDRNLEQSPDKRHWFVPHE